MFKVRSVATADASLAAILERSKFGIAMRASTDALAAAHEDVESEGPKKWEEAVEASSHKTIKRCSFLEPLSSMVC